MRLEITAVRWILGLIGASCVVALPEPLLDNDFNSNWSPEDIITRDVVIIGGGASGTYAAVRLGDFNQSVIIVESQDRLGGHTETYNDPVTKATIDLGVVVFHDLAVVRNFFGRFDVPLINTLNGNPGETGITDYVDLDTGRIVTDFTPSDPTAALKTYAAQLAQYSYLEAGFNLPDPVPADLLLPFGEFVTKYNISAAVDTIFEICQGIGDFLTRPTIYVFKLLGLSTLQSLQTGFLATPNSDTSELYVKAQAALSAANAVLLNSRVIATERCDSGEAKVIVFTPSGPRLIKAKKILITIPPTLSNLRPFDLNGTELSLFEQFSTTGYYTGLLRNGGIPDNTSIQNTGADSPYNLPTLPGLYGISSTSVPGLHKVLYGSTTPLSAAQVQGDILASVKRLGTAGTIKTTTPEFAVFESHAPFEFTVPASAIGGGFYKKLYGLQGYRQTFYSGAAFHTHDSSLLWEFTEGLLPSLVQG